MTAALGPLLHPLEIEWDGDLQGGDPLGWPGYAEAVASLPRGDSVITGRAVAGSGRVTARYVVIAGRFDVMGGSMGAVHGERVVRAFRRATLERLPVVTIANSGGARLQEGLVALAQLPRTSAAASAHRNAGLLSAAILRAPTAGGILASYASLSDVRAAEPGSTVAFAGPRLVELTTGQPVLAESHTAESAHALGLVDALVDRAGQAAWLETVLGLRDSPMPGRPLAAHSDDVGAGDGAWLEVLRARARSRPSGIDHAARLCDSWVELRGIDPVVRAGLARIGDRRLVVIAHDRHFGTGRPGPHGYRLARRALSLADRLHLPLLTLVDTPGADPGATSDGGGVAAEIAATFAEFAEARIPIVSVCVGEGGSGGALAHASGDVLLMLEHAIFEVLSPEGTAAVLARDVRKAPEYAGRLKLTAVDVVELGIADSWVPEGDPAALRSAVLRSLERAKPGDRLKRLDALTARWVR